MHSESMIQTLGEQLCGGGIENGRQEARWLFDFIRKQHPDWPDAQLSGALAPLVERRLTGEPLQYILGSVEFYDLDLEVGPGVLIPRPETEVLVDLALEKYSGTGSILDLCTGSGAILLNLASHYPGTACWGVDISPLALHWAELNQKKCGLPNITWLSGDLFAPVPDAAGPFALITANPPYVSPEEYAELSPTVKDYEPRSALYAEENGMAVTRRIIEEAPEHLQPGGWLLIEIGCTQSGEGLRLLEKNGYQNIASCKDYTGRERFITGRKNS